MEQKNMRPQYHEDQKPKKERRDLEENETLNDPGAPVADYGSSGTGEERLKQNSEKGGRSGDEQEETIGIP